MGTVRDILGSRREALLALAEELIVVESIESEDLQRIVEENSPGPRVVPGTGETVKRPVIKEPADDLASSEKSG